MPQFASIADMEARFEARDLDQLADPDGTGTRDDARIAFSLGRADAMIGAFIAARHADIGQLAGHPLLTDIACDLAFHDLWRSDPPAWVIDRRKGAVDQLRDIQSGRMRLDEGREVQPPRPDAIVSDGPARLLGRDPLGAF